MNQTALSEAFEGAFKFKIGDVVALRSDVVRYAAEIAVNGPMDVMSRAVANPAIVIVERLLVQCHGGVQGFYRVRVGDKDGRGAFLEITEHEVVPYSESAEQLLKLKRDGSERRRSWGEEKK